MQCNISFIKVIKCEVTNQQDSAAINKKQLTLFRLGFLETLYDWGGLNMPAFFACLYLDNYKH